MFFAATPPERVRSLVLVNAYAIYARDDDSRGDSAQI